MPQTIIPVGYRIHVTSWENDADNYKTQSVEGITKEQIPFVLAVLNLFRSKNRRGDTQNFGNLGDDESLDGLRAALEDKILEYSNRPEGCDNTDWLMDGLLNQLGLMGGSEYYATRVFDHVKIEYVPEKIVIEDVTEQFV